MTTFSVKGSRNGSKVRVTWTDGVLSGDPPTVDLVHVEAELAQLHPEDRQSWSFVMDPEHRLPNNPLADPAASWRLICSVLDTVQGGEGELPEEVVATIENSGPTQASSGSGPQSA